MPGMSPIACDALGEAGTDDLAPWSMPGMDEESPEEPPEEPQAASTSVRAAAAPAAAKPRRVVNRGERIGERNEERDKKRDIDVGLSRWAHHTGGARKRAGHRAGSGPGPVPARACHVRAMHT
ncbi:hypothetical protein GCM10014715_11840 [Streptomyces spiralis]|uniref:Uncharacterized protein n=1 Tax=Streptomyces spiralis TaxID=66376 RepID=A0A918ZNC6_9ACTN|nr:hypothetical protein GCM10014715_11840 [Streptomyces spiralis]